MKEQPAPMSMSYLEYSGNKVVEEHPPTGGTKHDTGKPDLSLCPKVALEIMARAFMYGEKKYHRYNYLKGFDSHRLIGAALRHLTAWQEGQDEDPESGLNHLGHALASIAMLLDCADKGSLTDTRFKK